MHMHTARKVGNTVKNSWHLGMLDSLTIFEDFFTLSNCSSCSRKSFFMSAIFCRCMHRVRDARWLLKYRNEFQRLKVESIQLVGVREDIHRRAETSDLHLRQIREINIIFQYSQNHCLHAFEKSRSWRILTFDEFFTRFFPGDFFFVSLLLYWTCTSTALSIVDFYLFMSAGLTPARTPLAAWAL